MTILNDLVLDEQHDLTFAVDISGTAVLDGSPEVRLVCECGDVSHSFVGRWGADGEVSVKIPRMSGVIRPGTYDAHLEVILSDRFFRPLSMKMQFVEPIRVVAETVDRDDVRGPSARLVRSVSDDEACQDEDDLITQMDRIIDEL